MAAEQTEQPAVCMVCEDEGYYAVHGQLVACHDCGKGAAAAKLLGAPDERGTRSLERVGRHRENAPVADSVVEAVVGELRARSDFGLLKYKQPLTRTDWTRKDRLIHALQEALDLANYLMAEVVAEENRPSDEDGKVPTD